MMHVHTECIIIIISEKSTGYILLNKIPISCTKKVTQTFYFLCGDRVPFCRINVFCLCGENHRINDFESQKKHDRTVCQS